MKTEGINIKQKTDRPKYKYIKNYITFKWSMHAIKRQIVRMDK